MLSPPCTAFSPLQSTWNYLKMTGEAVAAKLQAGTLFVDHSVEVAIKAAMRNINKHIWIMPAGLSLSDSRCFVSAEVVFAKILFETRLD